VLTYITETVAKVVDKSEENKKASLAVTAATEE